MSAHATTLARGLAASVAPLLFLFFSGAARADGFVDADPERKILEVYDRNGRTVFRATDVQDFEVSRDFVAVKRREGRQGRFMIVRRRDGSVLFTDRGVVDRFVVGEGLAVVEQEGTWTAIGVNGHIVRKRRGVDGYELGDGFLVVLAEGRLEIHRPEGTVFSMPRVERWSIVSDWVEVTTEDRFLIVDACGRVHRNRRR